MAKNYIIVFVFLILLSNSLYSQGIIKGRVYDEKREPLCASLIYLKSSISINTTTDIDGHFNLLVPESQEKDTLVVSFLGYKKKFVRIDMTDLSSEYLIVLEIDSRVLPGISVYANASLLEEFSIQKIEKMDIYMSPVASGDPLKAINILPSSTNVEESAEVELRGSSGDKSVVALNGVPINKPVRSTQMSGVGSFSLFNPEIIQTQDVYASNPPLTYGNALAGIVDIKTTEEVFQNSMIASISLANVGLMLNRNLSSESFIQIYGNVQFSEPYIALNKKSSEHLDFFKTKDIGINYHNKFSDQLIFNLYSYLITEEYKADSYLYNYKDVSRSSRDRWFQIMNLRYVFNRSTSLVWNSGIDISKTDYAFSVIKSKQKERTLYNSLDFRFSLKNIKIQTGTSYSNSNYNINDSLPLLYFALKPGSPNYKSISDTSNHNLELYWLAKYNFGQNFITSVGLRKNIPVDHQSSYTSYQLSARYNIDNKHSFLLGAGKYHSYKIPSFYQSKFNLQNSNQASLSYDYNSKLFFMKLSTYYKKEITTSWFSESTDNRDIENRMWGAELYMEKYLKNFIVTGSYAYLNAKYKYNETIFNSRNKMDYIVRISARYQNTKFWGGSLSYSMRPGLYYTPIESSFYLPLFDAYVPIYGSTNSSKEAPYNSLDLALNKTLFWNKRRITAFAIINNILDRKNIESRIYSDNYESVIDYWLYQRRSYYMGFQISF
ncbi:hypothetical protein AwDysgo_01170 [Bacteroidales bacterium]|nr:hypothetical protein AwDysgo_01170 [Bacteroidales bacterium]